MNEFNQNDTGAFAPAIDTVLKAALASEHAPKKKPGQLSPLTLAYIGDTVYDLYVRTYLIENTDYKVHGLHMLSKRMVCAGAQAKALAAVQDMFSDEELEIFKRGRNAHIGTVPRHASIGDYRAATGFEAVLGYLIMSGRDARCAEIMRTAIHATTPISEKRD